MDDKHPINTTYPSGDWERTAQELYDRGRYHEAADLLAMNQGAVLTESTANLELRARGQVRDAEGITVVLTGYQRPQNLIRQIRAINEQSVPVSDVMLWKNYGGAGVEFEEINEIKTASCNHNFKFHSRFAFALLAKTKYVAVFDDDTIPGPRWFENCLETLKTHNGILGSAGIVLKSQTAYRPHQKVGWNGAVPNEAVVEVDLVGHAWFMEKAVLKYMWFEEPHSWDNGEDIHLSYTAKKFGGIRTFVPPHPSDDKSLWGSTDGKALGNDSVSSFKNNNSNSHTRLRNEIVRNAIQAGWVTKEAPAGSPFASNIRPSAHVFIPTFNRPRQLKRLLNQINNEAPGFHITVHVHDDGSEQTVHIDASDYPNIAHIALSRSPNFGKKRYWELVNRFFRSAVHLKPDLFYYLADDVQLVKGFFSKSASLWHAVPDKYKVAMHLLLDQREGSACWTAFDPITIETGEGAVYKSQWVDMLMMFDRTFLEALKFEIQPVSLNRWISNPLASSGVGQQISHRLHEQQRSMYLVTDSLLIHEDEPSVMNPEERLANPIVSRRKNPSAEDYASSAGVESAVTVTPAATTQGPIVAFDDSIDRLRDQIRRLEEMRSHEVRAFHQV
ncbi:glycosyltransferase family 2 protein [Aquamicrobium terrae]